MIKFFATLLLFLSFSANPLGMQTNNITLSAPYFDIDKKEYVIEAINQDKKKIGSLAYFPIGGSRWQMRELYVDHDERKKGIARALLRECLAKIKELHASELSWQIHPNIGMTEEQLITIYFKMLKKIDPAYITHTTQEYRGSQDWYTPWMVLTLE